MKKLLIILLVCLSHIAFAQKITRLEYWVDTDPGFGKATPIMGITAANDISSFDFSLAGTLSKGIHVIGIRSKDEYGVWSHTNHVFIDVLDSSKGKIVELEYFWDEDPGFGNGQKQKPDVPIKDLNEAILKVNVPTTLSLGNHLLYVRSLDDRGRWSHTNFAGQVELLALTNDTVFIDTTVCSELVTPDGKTFRKTGVYIGAQQKGSRYQIIEYNLTVKPVDVGVIQNSATLTASAVGAKYQWVDCNNNHQPVAGETQNSFNATKIGSYAVIVTDGGCTDTSKCFNVSTVSIEPLDSDKGFKLYPNPNKGVFTIEFPSSFEGNKTMVITDVVGKKIAVFPISSKNSIINLEIEKGIYFIRLIDTKNKTSFTQKIIIQ